MSSDMRNLRIEAMYLCGWSIWDIAKSMSGGALDRRGRPRAYGSVNSFVTTRKLSEERGKESRPRRLVELSERTPKMRAVVDDLVALAVRLITADLKASRVKQEDHAEALARKRLAHDIAAIRAVPPEERDIVPEQVSLLSSRRIRIRNQDDEMEEAEPQINLATSTLGWLGSRGVIRPECVDAGEAMARDFQACGFRYGSADMSRSSIRGGVPGRSDPSLDASQRYREAIEAVRLAFPRKEVEQRLLLLEHVVIRDLYLNQFMSMPAHMANKRGAILDETLTAVAWAYGKLKDGPVARHLKDTIAARKAAG